jgi:hypothetical protein
MKICRVWLWNQEERRKKEGKKIKTGAKLNIFVPYMLPRNEGNTVRIKTLLWKPKFGHWTA